jgi:hypothetical protein
MLIRAILFFVFILIGIKAECQTFLNMDSSKIKKVIINNGGIQLRTRLAYNDVGRSGEYYLMMFRFSKSALNSNGINLMTFYLTKKNKCYKYLTSYVNTNYYHNKVAENFNQPNSGLKKVKDSLKWVNSSKRYIVNVLPNLVVNQLTFMVEIKNE